jgi:hypothetical protein
MWDKDMIEAFGPRNLMEDIITDDEDGEDTNNARIQSSSKRPRKNKRSVLLLVVRCFLMYGYISLSYREQKVSSGIDRLMRKLVNSARHSSGEHQWYICFQALTL